MSDLIAEEFAPAEDSIAWAKVAANELNAMAQGFFQGEIAEVVQDVDPDTGENVQKLVITADLPNDFRRKATEALNNARHSFDQSVFAARNILSKKSNKGVNYPWAADPTDLKRLLENRKIDPGSGKPSMTTSHTPLLTGTPAALTCFGRLLPSPIQSTRSA